MITRRRLLGTGLAAGIGAGVSGCSTGTTGQTAVPLTSALPLPTPFTLPFRPPPVKRPTGRVGTARRYDIDSKPAEVEIIPGSRTPIVGFDGSFPGPTIIAHRGEPVVVRHRTRSDRPVVVHLHGGHTPASSDGFPTDLLVRDRAVLAELRAGRPLRDDLPTDPNTDRPGRHDLHPPMIGEVAIGHRDHLYPSDQPAATLWYHDHTMDTTAPNVWHGLFGAHLIVDPGEETLGLPAGDRDVVMMIADRSFAADGSLTYPRGMDEVHRFTSGVLGDVVLVNGVPWPVMEVQAARYRLRLINASNARRYGLSCRTEDDRRIELVQIGSDGGLLAAPVRHRSLPVAAAERFDVVVDFGGLAPGTKVTMINDYGRGTTSQVMQFVLTGRTRDDSRVPDRLAEVEPLAVPAGARRRDWRFERGPTGSARWHVNGRTFDPQRSDAVVARGTTEVWRFAADLHHSVHVHQSAFQVLSRNGRPPLRSDAGWKDTVDVRPTEYVDVVVRFTDYAGTFMLHCHNLEHEDMGMMAAFTVT